MPLGLLRRWFERARNRLADLKRPWYKDLCDYYGVTPREAEALGARASGRRPDLPGSATAAPVSGRTMDQIWQQKERQTQAEIFSFYNEVGSWASFRQVLRHRYNRFPFLAGQVGPEVRFCEYGAGIAPAAFWMVERLKRPPRVITVVDVASEHFTFGQWRLRRLIQERGLDLELTAVLVQPERLPLTRTFDLITILEVFEHLPNPLEVVRHLHEHLAPGGHLWENYVVAQDTEDDNLAVSQEERPEVFRFLSDRFQLVSGLDPGSPGGGGTRCWRRI